MNAAVCIIQYTKKLETMRYEALLKDYVVSLYYTVIDIRWPRNILFVNANFIIKEIYSRNKRKPMPTIIQNEPACHALIVKVTFTIKVSMVHNIRKYV